MPLTADVAVAGGGVIGLCAALALAERGRTVILVGESATGEASRAAAGMLAPSVERASSEVDSFGIAARDRYPSYLEFLYERTGITVALNRRGILQAALTPAGVKGLRRSASPSSVWLDRDELIQLEPALAHALGAVHNPLDGSVNNVALMAALAAAVGNDAKISRLSGHVSTVSQNGDGVLVSTSDGRSVSAAFCILAAGAWSGSIAGAKLAAAVTPAKGQLVEFEVAPLSHVVYGPGGYVVPRGNATIAGSTMERTGFEASTSEAGIAKVTAAATEICPSLVKPGISRAWAGLRPVTPDLLPLLGHDPESPSIIYACGHGRNGILMAPLTGDLVADLVMGSPLPHDLAQFRPDRF